MPGPGYAKGRAKRREIVEQARALFGEAGYRGASLRDLAARARLSHPGLLHYFPTKEALLQAVLEHRDHEDAAWMAAGGIDGVGHLRRFVDLVALNATRRGIVELFTVLSAEATSSEHPAHAYFVERYAATVADVRRAYTRAAEVGALREGVDPDVAAPQLVALMDGLQLQWLLDDGTTDMAAVVRAHVQAQLSDPL
jgi:AcrR family transcriptional regulator